MLSDAQFFKQLKMNFYIIFIFCLILIKPSVSGSSPCKANWTPYLDLKCLTVIDEFHNYDDAIKSCKTADPSAIMLTIHSAEENTFITNYFFKTKQIKESIWIGAKLSGNKKDQFQWSDNSYLNYTNWAPHSPKNSTNTACVQMMAENLIAGKWADEPCSKRSNLAACQMPQSWSIEKLHEKLLQTREEVEAEKKFLRQNIEEERRQFASLKAELQSLVETEKKRSLAAESGLTSSVVATKSELQHAIASATGDVQGQINAIRSSPALPAGFIYVQLAGQPAPKSLWPGLNWADVTGQYAGHFFRAEGGGSAPFGQAQSDNAPRIAEIKTTWGPIGKFSAQVTMVPNQWSAFFFSGNSGSGDKDAFSIRLTGGEVRPKNMAIKVWKRV